MFDQNQYMITNFSVDKVFKKSTFNPNNLLSYHPTDCDSQLICSC